MNTKGNTTMNTVMIPAHELKEGDVVVIRVPTQHGGSLGDMREGRTYTDVITKTVMRITGMSGRTDSHGLHYPWKKDAPAPFLHIRFSRDGIVVVKRDFVYEVAR